MEADLMDVLVLRRLSIRNRRCIVSCSCIFTTPLNSPAIASPDGVFTYRFR